MPENEEIEDIYSEKYNEELEESDEINEIEKGFMQGYNEEKFIAECSNCKKILDDNFREEMIEDKTYRFCSRRCANEFSGEI